MYTIGMEDSKEISFLPIQSEMNIRYRLSLLMQNHVYPGIGTTYMLPPNPIHWNLLQLVPHKYWSILKLFFNPDMELVSYIVALTDSNHLQQTASSILSISELCGTTMALLRIFINFETLATKAQQNLFRANNVSSKLFRAFAELDDPNYLQKVFETPIKQCVAMTNDGLQLDQNIKDLKGIVGTFLDHVFIHQAPIRLRVLANCMQRIVMRKFPEARYNSVAAILFLRLFCPYITATNNFVFLDPNEPLLKLTKAAKTNLINISRILQKLANGARFNDNSSLNIELNNFLDDKTKALQTYLQDFCHPSMQQLFDQPYNITQETLIKQVNKKLHDFDYLYDILKSSTILSK